MKAFLPALLASLDLYDPLARYQRMAQDWGDDLAEWVRRDLPKFLVVLIVAIVLIRLLRLITHRLVKHSYKHPAEPGGLRSQQLRTLASVVNSVGAAIIAFVAAMQMLPLFGVNIGPLLASAGVAGLAIGFGAQTLVKDIINGFFILLENQYDVGDTVKLSGVSGSVEAMTLRRTTLRDANGTLHIIPNSNITIVSNLTRDWALVQLQATTDYDESSERVITLLKELLNNFRNEPDWSQVVVADPEVPGIERIAGREVDYLVLVKVHPGKQFAVGRELRRRIKECFDKNKVKAPTPARVFVADSMQNSPRTEMK